MICNIVVDEELTEELDRIIDQVNLLIKRVNEIVKELNNEY